ncbi:tyrosine--tRNA ligase [Sinorhizobium meliloti]|uniref:tyrosine--tRNA ligase n=1 Tax=Rhizobium meliloti TaxID=382 RepID=UPI0003F4F088|nr:tyrosine--tRNA ligase [Sinorhizobium meliloti]
MTTPPDQRFKPQSDFLRTLSERGFIHQCTDMTALDARLCDRPLVAYNGFDLTADSLHVGHLIPIMMLRWLQKTGHKPIVLMGGGTTRIGDPSFRDTSRPLLDNEQIATNFQGIRRVFERFLAFGDGPTDAVMVNNADWLDGLGYIDFLRDFGRHFSVNRMLTFDSVRQRLEREHSLSLLEFNYMVIQAYDFLELARTHSCVLQLGASDQWGNIVNGVELGRRVEGRELFGLTAPLLTTSSGAKMGKSASGAVWLNAERLAPYDFWQFWRNTEDGDVDRFLRLFTELPSAEIDRLSALRGAEINAAKKVLADEVTALCHGRDVAEAAHETALCVFEEGEAASGLPTIMVKAAHLRHGMPLADVMVAAGLVRSKSEARRMVRGGGVRVNDSTVDDEGLRLTDRDAQNGVIKLSTGRKRHALIRIA